MNELTIASLNTFGGSLNTKSISERYQAIGNYFNTSSADVVHFQEVFTYFHLNLLKKNLPSFPHSAFIKSYLGPKGGLVTFSRHPFAKSRYILYSRPFIPFLGPSIIELLTQRGMLISQITLERKTLTFVNTHLTAVINHVWTFQSKYFRELIHEILQFHTTLSALKSEGIVITVGDFNIAKGSELYQKLIDFPLLIDVFSQDKTPTLHDSNRRTLKSPVRIDYFFCYGSQQKYKVLNKKNIFTQQVKLNSSHWGLASDHSGLEVRLKLV
jgi:endonuclease/exonuclease/phosphatase family metal-dependent hydrolase